jgi:DNA repair protein RadC
VNVIVVHNHPGGTLAPSQADLDATARIIEAGRMMGIPVLDHLIVSSKGVYSFRREGLLTD